MSVIFLSDKATAERYGVGRTTIWRWIKNQNFPRPLNLSKGCTRWSIDDLERWERKRREDGPN